MNKSAMFKIGYGLYVLTASEGGKDNGCIINTALQVTDSPLRIGITVNKANYTHDMIVRTGKFNLSVLTEDSSFELFKKFGFVSGKDVDKFDGFDNVKRSENGVLYVTEAVNSYISGDVSNVVDLGTHTIFIADVTNCDVISDAASATYDYYHKNIKPAPEKTVKKGWRCKICGYVYEGDELPADFICPLCKHGADDFERIDID